MRNLMFIAGAASLLAVSPALADPGKGRGKGHKSVGHSQMHGGAVCPPGLAKKSPACVPPGQAKRMFREGQRLPNGYRYYTPYGDIPASLRDRYDLDDDYRYIYRDNQIYVVDPATSLVTRILDAIL